MGNVWRQWQDLAFVAADPIFNMSLTPEALSVRDKGFCKGLCCLRSRICLAQAQGGFVSSQLLPSAEFEKVFIALIVVSTNAEITSRQEVSVGFSACVCQAKGTQGVKIKAGSFWAGRSSRVRWKTEPQRGSSFTSTLLWFQG